jgi:BlaI family transcriptional regulator, penicillinase repressor
MMPHMSMILLHQNELEALRILWEGGELKPSEIQAKFSWPIDNGTLRSALLNLVEKKHITRKQQGKAFRYAARLPKATLLQNFMHQLAQVFAGGSHSELVAQLVETADIKPADLLLLRQTAAANTQKSKRKPK